VLYWFVFGLFTLLFDYVFISFWKVSLNNKIHIGLQSTRNCFGYQMKGPKISSQLNLSALRNSISLAVAVKFPYLLLAAFGLSSKIKFDFYQRVK
jgi:hypothetical protein